MVVKLWGQCNGARISFDRDPSGRWETTVPPAPDATYVMELWAEDTAGNVGYFATVLVTFDPTKLQTRVFVLRTGERWSLQEVREAFGVSPKIKETVK